MKAKHQYIVTFFNYSFESLKEAKYNIKIAFTCNEAIRILADEHIAHYVGDKLLSITPIKVDINGNISFGKTTLCNNVL